MAANSVRAVRQAGFTLLELLISIAIFAVVISSVYGAYRATFHTISGTDEHVLRAAAARVILERVTEDLEALYTGEDGFFEGENDQLGEGRADRLKFLSSAHLVFSREQTPAARAVIRYEGRESESGGFDLIRIDTPQLPGQQDDEEDQAQGEVLGKGLLSFSLSYYTREGEQSEDWQSNGSFAGEEASGENQVLELPALVRVEISFSGNAENSQPTRYRTSVALPRVLGEQEPQEGS